MENQFKRFLSLLIVMVMVVSMIPTSVFASAQDLASMTDEEVLELCLPLAAAGDEEALSAIAAELGQERAAAIEALYADMQEDAPAALAENMATVTAYKKVSYVTDVVVDANYYVQVGTATDLEAAVTLLKNAGADAGLILISEGTLMVSNRQDITMNNVIIKGAGKDKTTVTGDSAKFNNTTNGLANKSGLSSEYKAILGLATSNVKVMDLTVDSGSCGNDFGIFKGGRADLKTVRVNSGTVYLENLNIKGSKGRSNLMIGTSSTSAVVYAYGISVAKAYTVYGDTEIESGSKLTAVNSILGGTVVGSTENLGAGYYKLAYGGVTAYTTIPYAIECYNSGTFADMLAAYCTNEGVAEGVSVARAMTNDLVTVTSGEATLLYGKNCAEMRALAAEFKAALSGLSADTSVDVADCLADLEAALAKDQWHKVAKDGTCSVCGATGLEVPVSSPVVIPDTAVDTIVGTNTGVSVETAAGIVKEIEENTALNDFEPTNVPENAELVIELSSVTVENNAPVKIFYDVAPMDGTTKVQPQQAITFRLPVPASVLQAYARVYHEGESMGIYPIQGTGNGKFVEVSSADFSEFAVEPTDVAKDCVAKIGTTNYATLAEAIAAANEGDTVVILAGTVSEGTIKLPSTMKNVTIKGEEGAILKDMTISAADGNSYSYIGLTFDGITFDNSRLLFTGWRNGDEILEDLTVTNCVFKNLDDETNVAAVHVNKDVSEPVKNFTFTNNVVDGLTGGSKSGIYLQATGDVTITGNTFNNIVFRPALVQLADCDGLADDVVISNNTISNTTRLQVYGTEEGPDEGPWTPAGTDAMDVAINNNIFQNISGYYICTWGINADTDISRNYYDSTDLGGKIYWNNEKPADEAGLYELGVYPVYTELNNEGKINIDSAYTPVINYVAQVGTSKFTTISAAIEAWKANGGTLTLLANVDQSITLNYPAEGALTELVLDLNGFAVTSDESTLWVSDGYQVTVMDSSNEKTGKIVTTSSGDEAIAIARGGKVTLESGTVEGVSYGVYLYAGNATGEEAFNVNGGTVTVPNGGIAIAIGSGKVTVNGGKVLCNKVPQGGGWNTYVYANGNLEITGGEFLGTIGNFGTTSISGGTFSYCDDPNDGFRPAHLASGYTVQTNDDGSVTVVALPAPPEGFVWVSTYEELVAVLETDNAKVIFAQDITGTATQNSGYGAAGIVVNAGDIVDGNGYTLTVNGADELWDCAIAMCGGEVRNLTISGAMRGVFMPGANGDVLLDNCKFEDVGYTFNSDAGSKDYGVTIKNTELSGWTSFSDVHKFVTFDTCTFNKSSWGNQFCRPYQATTFKDCEFAEGFEVDTSATADNTLVFNGCTYNNEAIDATNGQDLFYNGGKVMIDGVSISYTVCAKIVRGEEELLFTDLQAAIDAAQTGDTITLLADVTLKNTVTVAADKDIVLELNGKTISQTQAQTGKYEMILNDGDLTIQDSVGGGKISYTDTVGGNFISNTITNRGTLTLKSGTVENNSSAAVAQAGFPYAIDTSIYGAASEVVVNIEGGTVTCANYSALRIFAQSKTEPITINVSGGEINGRIEVQNPSNKTTEDYAYVGVLNITGGTVNKNNSSMAVMIFGDGSTAAGLDVNISGGTVNGAVGYSPYFAVVNFNENVITGGTFDTDVSDFVAEGYKIVNNGNGTYGVEVDPAYGKEAKIGDTYYATLAAALAEANGAAIEVLCDVSGSFTGFENVTLTTNVEGGVTITNTSTEDIWFAFNNVNLGSGVTLIMPNVLINGAKDGGSTNVIEGTLITGVDGEKGTTLYQYNDAKTTVQNGGKIIVYGDTVLRCNYNADSGIFIYGDGDANTVEYSCGLYSGGYIGAYSGTFYAEDAVINCGDLRLDYYDLRNGVLKGEEDDKYAPINAQFENSTVNVTYQLRLYKDAHLTLTNSDVHAGLLQVRAKAAPVVTVDADSTLTADNAEAVTGALVDAIRDTEGNVTFKPMVAENSATGKTYSDLQVAIDEAQADTTITLLADVTASNIVVINKSITLDGNDHTLTTTAARGINVDCEGTVSIDNLTIENGANCERAINIIYKTVDLTLNNVTAENFKYTVNVSATQENIKLTINGGKFSGYAALNIVGSGSEVIVNNAELIGINNASIHESNGFAAISIGDVTYGSVTKGVKLTVNGGTITATSQGNVQNILCTSWNTEEVEAVIDAQLITYNGGIMYGEADIASFRAEYADELEAQGYIVSEPVDGMVTVECKAEATFNGVNYATLAEALAVASANGGTVTLLADCTSNEMFISVPAGVTLDLNGYTWIVNYNMWNFGDVVDGTSGGEGLLVLAGNGNAILKEDNTFLPLYDAAAGGYRFFAYGIRARGTKTSDPGDPLVITYGFAVDFANPEAYLLMKDTANSGLCLKIDLKWTNMPANKTVTYTVTDATVASFATNAYKQIVEEGKEKTTRVVTVNVSGLEKFAVGTEFTATLNLYAAMKMVSPDASQSATKGE